MSADLARISNIIPDRGPARYFHGRREILCDFSDLLVRATKENNGTTFLIQGAPGAGKTALLDKCGKLAKASGWKVAEIDPPALWDTEELLYYLGKDTHPQITGMSGQVGVDAVVKAEGKLDMTINHARPIMQKILADGKKPLLLILDEAQTLGKTNQPPNKELKGVTTNVLNAIHNGKLKRSIILLVAGLGPTGDAFSSLGISRFKGGCFVELGALDKESERAVIHDWIVKEGRARGNPASWIDAIAQKTHGWPQHIIAYGDAAAKQIQKDKRVMTLSGLDIVYQLGEERCEAYYQQRANGITIKERCSLARLMKNTTPGKGFYQEDIEEALSQEYDDSDKAKRLFKRAVERGILHSQDEVYTIPIPSMRTWLVSNYSSLEN